MPRKERLKKERIKELQQAAQGSSSLLSWMKGKPHDGRSESKSLTVVCLRLYAIDLLHWANGIEKSYHILFLSGLYNISRH